MVVAYLCCVIGQPDASTHAALPLAYRLLSSLVVVRRRAEPPGGGRRHRVRRSALVGPCAIRGAVRRRRRAAAGLVARVRHEKTHGRDDDDEWLRRSPCL